MEQLLECVMDIGEQMLICGGEVHRVEDSMKRIFFALEAARTDVFIITSSMVVTVHTKDGKSHTQTRRINETGTDFEKLHELNMLSRRICSSRMNYHSIKSELRRIEGTKKYPLWLDFICNAVVSAVFTLFFGGGIAEAVASAINGLFVRLLITTSNRLISNRIFTKFLASFAATALAWAAFKAGLIPGAQKVIIGGIMSLLPGLGLTNALRDLLVGDSIAGILRTFEAVMTTLAIAAGYFVLAMITGGVAV